jgi:hypothetical protein
MASDIIISQYWQRKQMRSLAKSGCFFCRVSPLSCPWEKTARRNGQEAASFICDNLPCPGTGWGETSGCVYIMLTERTLLSFKPLRKKHNKLNLKAQFVPRSKHTPLDYQNLSLLYRAKVDVCSQIHTKNINTLCGQNVELLNVKLVVHIVTTGI